MDHSFEEDYSMQERVACCFWFDISRSTDEVQKKFKQRFGSKKMAPSRTDIRHWYQRFIKTGCLIHDDNGNLDLDLFQPSKESHETSKHYCQSGRITSNEHQESSLNYAKNGILESGTNGCGHDSGKIEPESSEIITKTKKTKSIRTIKTSINNKDTVTNGNCKKKLKNKKNSEYSEKQPRHSSRQPRKSPIKRKK